MSHFKVKLDLAKLKHVVREMPTQNGGTTKVLIVPIPENHLFHSEKGAVYLDLIAFENSEVRFDQTHSIKQSLPKEVTDKMSDEQKKTMPFIGNMTPTGSSGKQNSAPAATAGSEFGGALPDFGTPPPTTGAATKGDLDDLPF